MFYRNEDTSTGALSDLLPWGTIVHGPQPTVLRNKDATFMCTLSYRGEDVAMLNAATRAVYLHRLNAVLMRLGTGWGLLADEWHEVTTDYPTSAWTNPVPCFVDAARRALFESGVLYESELFLTLCWRPQQTTKARWYDHWFQSQSVDHGDQTRQDLQAFVHAVTRWSDGLTSLFPAWHWLDPDETLTYLHRYVSWDRHQVRMPELATHLASRLASTNFLPGHTPQLGDVIPGSQPLRLAKYLRPLDIQQWPQGKPEDGGGLGIEVPLALQQLPFPYRFTVRYIPLDKADAERTLRDYMRHWGTLMKEAWPWWMAAPFPTEAPAHQASLEGGLINLLAGEVRHGYITPTVLVWADTEEELATRERAVAKALQDKGMIVAKEHVNACQAWLGMQPGDLVHNIRAPLLPSLAMAFLLPHASVWAGEEQDRHLNGPPLLTVSSDGTPFRFVLHQQDLGHCLLVGPSGNGKSGKLGLMAMQALRYPGARNICFDKDEGLLVATGLAGGAHYHLGGATSIGLQPLGRVSETEQERRWAWEWLVKLFEAERLSPTPEEKEEIWQAILRLANVPQAMRTMTGFAELLQVQRLKRGLAGFCQGGRYAFFDATEDSFSFDTHWVTFEMREILDQPGALHHALRYKFHRIESLFDGSPIFIWLDEVKPLLTDEIMGSEIMDWIKERRKFNVSVILATQELSDVAQTKAWQAVLANCPTKIFLANPNALSSEVMPYYQACGLSDTHIAIIARATPLQDYFYASPHGNRLYQLRLGEVERLLCAASKQDERTAFKVLMQEAQKEPLPAAWLRSRGQPEAADVFSEYYSQKDTA